MMKSRFVAALAASVLWAVGSACAAEFRPAIVFDIGGKFDKSFNEAAFNGAEKFRAETGIAYRAVEIPEPSKREDTLRAAARGGATIVVAMGFAQGPSVARVALEYPATRFTLIDAVVDRPNVQSVIFREQEGSFLVGMAAALVSKSRAIGIIGGMDIPPIRKFFAGYVQGARHADPDIVVRRDFVGTTPAAWNDPARGADLANRQFDRGVDVVFAAAGGTGLGVYRAASKRGRLAIGVDTNQNYLHPGTMLTSMVKRVDRAVHEAFKSAANGSWKSGVRRLGLKEDGVGYALDDHNRSLITPAMEARIEQARKDIVSGRIAVVDPAAKK